MNIFQRIIAVVVAMFAGLMPAAVFAQTKKVQDGLREAAGAYDTTKTVDQAQLFLIIGRFIGIAFDVFGLLLLGYLMYGGYHWLTAGGDSKKVDQAKDTIKNAIIGVIILVTANFIAGYVLGRLECVVGVNIAC